MLKKKIKLIALDMDGTLLQNDHQTISKRTKDALTAAVARGIVVVPATGRAQALLPQQLLEMNCIDYAITSNGAAVYNMHEGKEIYTDLLSPDTTRMVLDVFKPYRLFAQVYCHGKIYIERADEGNVSSILFHPEFVEQIRRMQISVGNFEELLQKYPQGIEKYNLPHLEPALRSRLWKQVSAMPGVSVISAIEDNMEINSKTCSKGRALSYLCQGLSIEPENVMVAGDSGNDLQMLAFTENSFAMANGTEEVKAAARYITASNEEDGVAQAIETYAL